MVQKRKLKCGHCHKLFEKEEKEYKRRVKKGQTTFFCSLSCSGKFNGFKEEYRFKETKHLEQYKKTKDSLSPFREVLRRCKKRKHDCTIDLDYLKELWEDQEGKCVYTGVNLVLPSTNTEPISYNYYASLDRIDSKNGYIEGNVQYVSASVNWLKNQFSNDHILEFFSIIKGRK